MSNNIKNIAKRFKAIGVFDNSAITEAALQELDDSLLLDRVFVVARNLDEETELVGSELCEPLRDRFDDKVNSAAPQDISIIAGEIVINLAKALMQLDIPKDAARTYNDLVAQGKYLVMLEGSQSDISEAKAILKNHNIQDWTVYEIVAEHPEIIVIDRRGVA